MKISMKVIILFAILFGTYQLNYGQEMAVTETGDTIIIFMDGSWTYVDGSIANYIEMEITLDTSDVAFTCPESSKQKVSSDLEYFDVMYDPSVWKRIPPGELNDEAEMAFEGKGFDAYAVIISEEVEIGTKNIFKIALDNMAEYLGTEVDILASEVREVNGENLIMMPSATNIIVMTT